MSINCIIFCILVLSRNSLNHPSELARHTLFESKQYKSFLFGLTEYRNRCRKGVLAHLGEKKSRNPKYTFQLICSKNLLAVIFSSSKLKVYIMQKMRMEQLHIFVTDYPTLLLVIWHENGSAHKHTRT